MSQSAMEEVSAPLGILVIESNSDHVHLIKDVIHQRSPQHMVTAIADGREAMDFLLKRGDYTSASRPDLILLNLDLPGRNGKEILAEMKAHPQLRRIPIVVLATSAEEEDVFTSYALQGNCYVIKSFDLEQLSHLVKRIEEFWLGIVTLPIE